MLFSHFPLPKNSNEHITITSIITDLLSFMVSSTEGVSPPLATSRCSPAKKCRPPFHKHHTRASCISFAAALGRESGLQTTPRTKDHIQRPGSSHRRLTTDTTTQWHFLTRTSTERQATPADDPQAPLVRPRTRPSTARVLRSPVSTAAQLQLPKRPATCRDRKTTPRTTPGTLVDPRVVQEAAHRETEQEEYTGPLIGKSVDVQVATTTTVLSDTCVVNAISRSEFHRVKAFQARARGDHTQAISHYEKLVERLPNDHVALFQLAVAYEKAGHVRSAQTAYSRVLVLDTDNPFVYYNLGNLQMKMNEIESAIASYSTAIHKSGSGKCQHMAFYKQRGAAYRKHGDFEKAAQDYARVHVVNKRRDSLTLSSRDSVNELLSTSLQTEDLVSDKYSAEPIYSSRLFMSSVPVEASVQELSLRRAVAIASRRPSDRTPDDLWALSDEMARCFPWCTALHPTAQAELSRRVCVGIGLPRGALLIEETADCTSGGALVLFILRGRVSIYKRFVPHVTLSFHPTHQQQNAKETTEPTVAWETLRGALWDDPAHVDQEKFELLQSLARDVSVVDLDGWNGDPHNQQVLLTHLTTGEVCGRQGRFVHAEEASTRSYTAVVSEPCDFFAVSWADYLAVERLHRVASSDQTARFLCTLPLFHTLPPDELLRLARAATTSKVVGQRVLCSEGQYVNGLVVVREGTLCQLHPSHLDHPPNLSVAFGLSGSVSMNGQSANHGGRHLFTQLEFQDDPLLFLHDSGAMHGFLSPQYLPKMLEKLSTSEEPSHTNDQSLLVAPPPVGASSLSRGGFFCASSAWIPPRPGSSLASSDGVACAKSALVSTETCELLFFSSRDLIENLSLASRAQLQKNIHSILSRRTQNVAATAKGTDVTLTSNLRRLVFLKPPSGDNLVQQFVHNVDWQSYKKELVQSIVQDNRLRKHRSNNAVSIVLPRTSRRQWQR